MAGQTGFSPATNQSALFFGVLLELLSHIISAFKWAAVKMRQIELCGMFSDLAGIKGLEPFAYWLTASRSNQLS